MRGPGPREVQALEPSQGQRGHKDGWRLLGTSDRPAWPVPRFRCKFGLEVEAREEAGVQVGLFGEVEGVQVVG